MQKMGFLAIDFGRDAADMAIFNQSGPAVLPCGQQVTVEQMPEAPR